MAIRVNDNTNTVSEHSLVLIDVRVIRWRGPQHPTYQAIAKKMEDEGLRPYAWAQGPNFRDGVRSHGYGKVLYCVEGVLEINLPDMGQQVLMRPGDRIELPRGIRHSIVVGPRGARCAEGVVRTESPQVQKSSRLQ